MGFLICNDLISSTYTQTISINDLKFEHIKALLSSFVPGVFDLFPKQTIKHQCAGDSE